MCWSLQTVLIGTSCTRQLQTARAFISQRGYPSLTSRTVSGNNGNPDRYPSYYNWKDSMQTDYPPVDNILVYMCRYVHACAYTCILLVTANNKKKNVYRNYPRYSDISTPYHACSKIRTSTIYYPMLCLKVAGWAVWTLLGRVSHLGLHYLPRPACLNAYGGCGFCDTV